MFYYFNKEYQYEKLRVPYFDTTTNKKRIYIVDFVNFEEKVAVEIKPLECIKEKEICKLKSLYKWCKENDFTMKILTNKQIKELSKNITDLSEFDESTKIKIVKLQK